MSSVVPVLVFMFQLKSTLPLYLYKPLLKSECLGEKFRRLVVVAEFRIDSALGSSGI